MVNKKSLWTCTKCASPTSNVIAGDKIEKIIKQDQSMDDNFKSVMDKLTFAENNYRLIHEVWSKFKKSN